MDPEFSQVMSTSVVALGVSIVIFLITLVLVVKRLIGFFITLLLLFFAIAAGYAILNHDIVRDYLIQATSKPLPAQEKESTIHQVQRKVLETVEELREELNEQKNRLQHFFEEQFDGTKTSTETPKAIEPPKK